MSQDAYKNGPMFFRLEAPGGGSAVTHAGLLEFSAAEGFVALPLKVSRIHSGGEGQGGAGWGGEEPHAVPQKLPAVQVCWGGAPYSNLGEFWLS